MRVIIDPENGKVVIGECNCEASSHVAALLYALLNYRVLIDINGNGACTSKLFSWNQGRKKTQLKSVESGQENSHYCKCSQVFYN